MFIPQHYRRLKRGPQVILPKDIGSILAYSGINKDSVCVDAGTGSGWLAISLARVAKKVVSYDNRDDFIKIAKKNKENEMCENLTIKRGDVTKKITEKNVDIVTLDIPDSHKALKNAHKSLKEGGCVVGYLPHMEQVKAFVETLQKLKFRQIVTLENIERDILVREQGVRPSTKGVWHTAYLVFAFK
ncbi:MAG: methyltransferase domain-containing protein [Candidatus Marsarchaeota archaeon]|nr:methyltransferase domain-containing protein [Candidatus Marsarchaeota archaeon]